MILPEPQSTEVKETPEAKQTLNPKYGKICAADTLPEAEGKKITGESKVLEAEADKLAAQGKHQEAVRKYGEAGAALLNEAIADGTISKMNADSGSMDEETFFSTYKRLIQASAESSFKTGRSYVQLGKLENAIDCFNKSLKFRIAPPNDAIVYLNRCDA